MKKTLKAIIALSTLGLTLGAALAVGVKTSEKEIEKADALTEGKIYIRCTLPNGWTNNLKCHHFGGSTANTTWPGDTAIGDYTNDYGQMVKIFEIPADRTGIIFNDDGWQTDDINFDANSTTCWYLNTKITSGKIEYGTWNPTTYEIKVYDRDNALNGDVHLYAFRNSAVNTDHVEMQKLSMSYLSDNFYKLDVDEMYSNFIVTDGAFSDHGGKQSADQIPNSQKYWVITGVEGSAISGKFFDDNDYVYAMDWYNYEMHMNDYDPELHVGEHVENDGKCSSEGYFSKAKSALATYPGILNQLFYVTGHTNAAARFNAWAAACTDSARLSLENETYVLNSRYYFPVYAPEQTVNPTGIIILASSVAFIAVSGYFLLRKARKED